MLNVASPIPLYQQIAELLRRALHAGQYPAKEKIPSEPELAQTYGIGRPTVRQATDMLVREGLLERRRGSGTYVLPKTKHIDLFSLSGTGLALEASDVVALVEWLELPELVTAQESLGGFDSSFRLQRITRIDDEPVLLETFYLDAQVFVDFDRRFNAGQSLSAQVKQQYHHSVTSAEQNFRIMFPSRKLADLMQVNNKLPLLHVARQLNFGVVSTGLSKSLDAAIYCDIICRTDRYNFSQTIYANP